MDVTRFITVTAVLSSKNELIPIWDERIRYSKSEMYGHEVEIEGERGSKNLVECIYDLKTKTLSAGIEIDVYPQKDKLEYKIGEEVLVEVGLNRVLEKTKIVDIVYTEFDLTIRKGKKIENYQIGYNKDLVIDPNSLYSIKNWKPFYVLENGAVIEYTYKLYRLKK